MELKTKVHAGDGTHDITIKREFDLPVDLLFKACTEAEFIEQWMNTKVIRFEGKKHGSYQFETSNAQGQVVLQMGGVIHDLVTNQKIIRTFEMANTPFGVQLEVYEFESLTESTSRLNAHIIYESVAQRDQLLQMPFRQGLNMAHNRLEEIISKFK
ncbi:SRPBCC family protein [Mucilaginibacter panaciglaebae]|uniref:Activator of Hsp90 ATPase homologue 1/2-like C-terminal domain-containing protein n=1 Tax=Mucilaginibacter panaciglaebae TaxID=502331 RepID=A0ABP7WZ84_9SPHI